METSKKSKKELKAEHKKIRKGFLKGFKDFITRGNILDMAVGVIMATAFTAIIGALVNGVFLQLISVLTGNAHFTDLVWLIPNGQYVPDPVTGINVAQYTPIYYGTLIQATINFVLVALILYFLVYVLIKRQVKKDIIAAEQAKIKADNDAIAAKAKAEADLAAATKAIEEKNQELAMKQQMIDLLKEINRGINK